MSIQHKAAAWGVSEKAAQLHSDSFVWEGCISWISMEIMHSDRTIKKECLPRYLASGANYVSLTVAGDSGGLVASAIHYIAGERKFIRETMADSCILVESYDDLDRARREGKLAVGFHFQGCNPMHGGLAEEPGDTNLVQLYYDLGIKQALLAHNRRNISADGCHEDGNAGLSTFGVKLVNEMSRVGMLLDCTHTSERSTMEAMEIYGQPVIFSHSNPKAIFDHPRNITDAQIKACAETGGVVGACGWGPIVNADNDASPEAVMKHIEYLVDLVGPAHVGIGLDYVYQPELTTRRMQRQPEYYAPTKDMKSFGYDVALMDFMPPEGLPKLTELMLQRGYSDEAIGGILGGNFRRVVKQVWK